MYNYIILIIRYLKYNFSFFSILPIVKKRIKSQVKITKNLVEVIPLSHLRKWSFRIGKDGKVTIR